MILDIIPSWFVIFLFPIVTILLWHLLFNSSNVLFTKVIVEGGYMLMGIPIMIITILSIPTMGVIFWANSQDLGKEVILAVLAITGVVIIIVEYVWIKKQINSIEEREQMSIWSYYRLQLSPEVRKSKMEARKKNKDEAASYFDEIQIMNQKRRELDREEKEKLRRALLGELGTE